MNLDRKNELHKHLVELYEQGESFDYGSLVYEYEEVSADQNVAIDTLNERYPDDLELSSLGFNYGYSSFLDCLVGKKQCRVKPGKKVEFETQVCVFILFCNYKSIYVLGEHVYYGESGFALPGFPSVDNFTTNRTSSLAKEVNALLEKTAYRRALASELDGNIPDIIKTESNMITDRPRVFDGYFNWTDWANRTLTFD